SHVDPAICPAVEAAPGPRAVDTLAVSPKPGAKALEPLKLLGRNLRILATWANIEKEIAVFGHRVDETMHQRLDAFVVGVRVAAVVSEGVAHAARRLPLLRRDAIEGGVFRRAEVAVRRQLRDDAPGPLRL